MQIGWLFGPLNPPPIRQTGIPVRLHGAFWFTAQLLRSRHPHRTFRAFPETSTNPATHPHTPRPSRPSSPSCFARMSYCSHFSYFSCFYVLLRLLFLLLLLLSNLKSQICNPAFPALKFDHLTISSPHATTLRGLAKKGCVPFFQLTPHAKPPTHLPTPPRRTQTPRGKQAHTRNQLFRPTFTHAFPIFALLRSHDHCRWRSEPPRASHQKTLPTPICPASFPRRGTTPIAQSRPRRGALTPPRKDSA